MVRTKFSNERKQRSTKPFPWETRKGMKPSSEAPTFDNEPRVSNKDLQKNDMEIEANSGYAFPRNEFPKLCRGVDLRNLGDSQLESEILDA